MSTMFETNTSKLARADDNVAGMLAGTKLGLTKAVLPLNNDTTYANVDAAENKCNFDGYARQNIDWGDPYIAEDGAVEVLGITPEFRPTGNNVDNDAIAATVTNGNNTDLYFIGNIDGQPISMKTELDSITLVVRFRPASNTFLVGIV